MLSHSADYSIRSMVKSSLVLQHQDNGYPSVTTVYGVSVRGSNLKHIGQVPTAPCPSLSAFFFLSFYIVSESQKKIRGYGRDKEHCSCVETDHE